MKNKIFNVLFILIISLFIFNPAFANTNTTYKTYVPMIVVPTKYTIRVCTPLQCDILGWVGNNTYEGIYEAIYENWGEITIDGIPYIMEYHWNNQTFDNEHPYPYVIMSIVIELNTFYYSWWIKK